MTAYTLFGAGRCLVTFLHGPPYDVMQASRFQTPSLVINLFICIMGLFFLLMLSSELVAIVEAQSLHDHVSGALNRRGIDQRLALELIRAERNGYQLAIALIDIDHFKQINDTAGHAAGDAALRQVVEVISARLRSYDFFGRFGGDEFLLVLPQTSCDDALRIAERMKHAVSGLAVSRFALPITLSIGLTFATPGETAPRCLLAPIWRSTTPNEQAATASESFLSRSIKTVQTTPIPSPHRAPVRAEAWPMVRRPMPILEVM
jgi:diguanylate cyclase (GGDEF)-like protein